MERRPEAGSQPHRGIAPRFNRRRERCQHHGNAKAVYDQRNVGAAKSFVELGSAGDRDTSMRRHACGYPVGDETNTSDHRGRMSRFQQGEIWWYPEKGAFVAKSRRKHWWWA